MSETSIQTIQTPAFRAQVNTILIIKRQDQAYAARVYEKKDEGLGITLKTTMGNYTYEHTELIEVALVG